MDSKIKILIGVLVVGIILIGVWWVWNSVNLISGIPKQEVTIATDKTEYEQGETVEITVKNNLGAPTWYAKEVNCGASFWLLENCRGEEMLYDLICLWDYYQHGFTKFEQGKILNGKWEGMFLNQEYKLEVAKPGCYRIVFPYSKKEKKPTGEGWERDMIKIYSNEFTIKEKTAQSQTVIIATDKTEYVQGEDIKITVKNGLNKPIWYIKEICPPSCCNLYRWENNEWKNLGLYSECVQFAGPYTIQPDKLETREEIKKQWDMKVITGKLERGFVESGKYRFSFYYGLSENSYTEETIYSNEFTIK